IATPRVVDEFEARLVAEVSKLRRGDPLDRTTQIGPLARGDLREALDVLVTDSVAAGARALVGARAYAGRGFYYEPTVLAGVTTKMPVMTQETFGPVAAVLRARDAEDAVAIA